MGAKEHAGIAEAIGRGVVTGVAGTGVMPVFREFVEMPVTGRGDSHVPAELAERCCR